METIFKEDILRVVKAIPRGAVLSYGAVATAAGYRGAARAVGSLMSKNYDPMVPCHRVISASGSIGAYNRGGPAKKAQILSEEGVMIHNNKVVKIKN